MSFKRFFAPPGPNSVPRERGTAKDNEFVYFSKHFVLDVPFVADRFGKKTTPLKRLLAQLGKA